MLLPSPRGPVSGRVVDALGREACDVAVPDLDLSLDLPVSDPLRDEDFQLALWMLYELHYRGFDDVDGRWEWDTRLLVGRAQLEAAFEQALRTATASLVGRASEDSDDVIEQIRQLIDAVEGPDLARFLQREATRDEFLEQLKQRSIYTLKESDPSSFVLPRVDGGVKAALASLQYDEYGSGRAHRLHATLFADALRACGLDPAYGAYVDEATAETLAANNAASLFCLHRRLRGAALGHLAAFEATSTLPCRRIASGVQRLDLGEAVWDYFDEHVEADAVHEEVALRAICAPAVAAEPALRGDVLFGAATCLVLEALAATEFLADRQPGRRGTSLPGERVPA